MRCSDNFFKLLLFLAALIIEAEISYAAEKASWALVRVSVANVREEPSHAAEMGSQVIMGTPVKLGDCHNGWWSVETPEGYKGYIIDNSLKPITSSRMGKWRRSRRVIVTSPDQTYVFDKPDVNDPLARVADVVNGSILQADGDSVAGFWPVKLPDGRAGFIATRDAALFERGVYCGDCMHGVTDFARRLMGVPYLWGGTSSKSMDCSGLSKISYLSQGVILPRNASQQAKVGMEVGSGETLQAGGLIFFGNKATGRINHVGIYIGDNHYIHSSGRVRVSSLNRADSDFEAADIITVKHLTRSDLDRLSIFNHSWFFER